MTTDLVPFGRIIDTRVVPPPVIVEPYDRPDVTGVYAEWRFPNGWGASVIPTGWPGEVELAVRRQAPDDSWPIDYRTNITGDVRRIDDPAELIDVLTVIYQGPTVERCCNVPGGCQYLH